MKNSEILARLEDAFKRMAPIRGHIEGGLTDETALKMGIALGSLAKAISLVKRDIESWQAELAKTQRRPN